jgi:hypothetical protein
VKIFVDSEGKVVKAPTIGWHHCLCCGSWMCFYMSFISLCTNTIGYWTKLSWKKKERGFSSTVNSQSHHFTCWQVSNEECECKAWHVCRKSVSSLQSSDNTVVFQKWPWWQKLKFTGCAQWSVIGKSICSLYTASLYLVLWTALHSSSALLGNNFINSKHKL